MGGPSPGDTIGQMVARDLKAINQVLVDHGFPQMRVNPADLLASVTLNRYINEAMKSNGLMFSLSLDRVGFAEAAPRLREHLIKFPPTNCCTCGARYIPTEEQRSLPTTFHTCRDCPRF